MRIRVLPAATLLLILAQGAAVAQDSEESNLKRSFDRALETLNAKDLEAFSALWHPEAVIFPRTETYPTDRSDMDQATWNAYFDDYFQRIISAGYTQNAIDFRVIGDTGLVWGVTRWAVDERRGGGYDLETRLTVVFARLEGVWKIVHWSHSPSPEGRR